MSEGEPKGPQSLLGLLGFLLKAGAKGLVIRLPIAMTLGFFAWLAHTYLVVVINEGFNPNYAKTYTQLLALPGQYIGGSAAWGLAAFIVTSLAWRFVFRGPIRTTKELLTTPSWVFGGFRSSGPIGVGFTIAGMALGVAIGTFLNHRLATIQLAIGTALSVAMQGSGLLLIASALAWKDVHRWTDGLIREKAPIAWLVVLQVGLVGGLIRAASMPFQPTSGWSTAGGLVLLAVVVGIAGAALRRSPVTAIALVVFAGLAASGVAIADDGGWVEAGGSFDRWIWSPGAGFAVGIGLLPAGAVLAGGWVGGLVGGIREDDLPTVELDDLLEEILEDLEDAIDQNLAEEEEEEDDLLDEILEDLENAIDENLAEEDEADEEVGEPEPDEEPKGPSQDVKDGKDLFTGFVGTGIPRRLGELAMGLTEGADEAIEAYADWLRNNAEILDDGLVRFADDAARDSGLRQMLDAIEVNRWAGALEDGATVVGVVFDTWDNVNQGDNFFVGIGKASGAGALMVRLGQLEPGLGLMEFGNFLAFGGSEAADIISPTKTIGGAYNAIHDTLTGNTGDLDSVADRVARGDYGPNLRNLGEAGTIAGEYWGDPDQVGQELADFVSDDSTWDDMYDRAHEVWAPKDDAWGPKRAALATGELVTDGVIKAGELAADAGQIAGDITQRTINQIESWFS